MTEQAALQPMQAPPRYIKLFDGNRPIKKK